MTTTLVRGLTGLALELLDLDLVTGGNAVLLAARLDHCEHRKTSLRSWSAALIGRYGSCGRALRRRTVRSPREMNLARGRPAGLKRNGMPGEP